MITRLRRLLNKLAGAHVAGSNEQGDEPGPVRADDRV